VKKSERITAMITIVGGVMIIYYAWNTLKLGSIHMPDAGLLPFLCGVGLTILGIVWSVILQVTKEKADQGPVEKGRWHKPCLALVLMVIYGWAFEEIGYITSTLVFMVAWQQVIEREKWVKTIIISVLGTVSMYALFAYILKVPIPQELFLR
jgi:putative tricarboxylic transport membrane protein